MRNILEHKRVETVTLTKQHFAVDTADAVDLSWAPDGRAVCVWDGPLACHAAVHAMDGRRLAALAPLGPDCLGLGIKVAL